MKKNALIILLIAAGAMMAGLLFVRKGTQNSADTRMRVVASFYPLAHFVEQVGGSRVDVYNLTPAGAEPHDFEPTPRDIVRLQEASLIVLNGAGFETWFTGLKDSIEFSGTVLAVTDRMELLPLEHGHDEEEDETREGFDPHVWLDPVLAQREIEIIRDALIAVDPDGREVYEINAAAYIRELAALDSEYKRVLLSCEQRTIIVPHNAFQYLGDRYTIEIESIAGLSPDEEPSPKRMAELSKIAKDNGIKYIFFETLVSRKLADTIAAEADVETLVLNPLEGLTADQVQAGETYISVMKNNLEQLRKAMDCT